MRARSYGLALAGFAALMAGGLGLGWLLNRGPARLEPAQVELDAGADELRLVLVGNTGQDGPDTRQVRQAAAAWCAERACDAVILLGDVLGAGGPEDLGDPRLADRLSPWAAVAPVYLVAGDRDLGPLRDPRAVGRLVRWTGRQADVHLPSATWSSRTGEVLLVALDSNELLDGGAGADQQVAWLDEALRTSTARWPLALLHDVRAADSAHLCGRVALIAHAGPVRGWTERCGVAFLAAGLGEGGPPPQLPGSAEVLHVVSDPGFVGLDLTPDRARVSFVSADRRISFQAWRSPDGRVELDEGSVLRSPP